MRKVTYFLVLQVHNNIALTDAQKSAQEIQVLSSQSQNLNSGTATEDNAFEILTFNGVIIGLGGTHHEIIKLSLIHCFLTSAHFLSLSGVFCRFLI